MKVVKQTTNEITIKFSWTEAEALTWELASVDKSLFCAGNLFGEPKLKKQLKKIKNTEMDFVMFEILDHALNNYLEDYG